MLYYGTRARKLRKWIADVYTKKEAILSYRPIVRREVGRVLTLLLAEPDSFSKHFTTYVCLSAIHALCPVADPNAMSELQRFSASMLMEITYGHRAATDDDYYVRIADHAIEETAKLAGMGSTVVDFFPFCECQVPTRRE